MKSIHAIMLSVIALLPMSLAAPPGVQAYPIADGAISHATPDTHSPNTAISDRIASIEASVQHQPDDLNTTSGSASLPPHGHSPSNPPAPAARTLSCGETTQAGSVLPTTFGGTFNWQPPRGPEAGSAVSVAASALTWTDPQHHQPDQVVIVGECAWADALAASGFTTDGPLLLTDPNTLEQEVSDEIDRLNAKLAIIVGGEQAVSPAVAKAIGQKGMQVNRFEGATRIETAAEVGIAYGRTSQDPRFIVARAHPAPDGSPSQAFADSLGSSYASVRMGTAIVLSEQGSLSPATRTVMDTYDPAEVWIMGGHSALGPAVEQALQRPGELPRIVTRMAGPTRAGTAAMLAKHFMQGGDGTPVNGVLVLDSQGDDAWKAGFSFAGLAGKEGWVYALVNGDQVPDETKEILALARQAGKPVACVASAKACAQVRSGS